MKSKDDKDNEKIKEIKKYLKILKIGSDKEKSDGLFDFSIFARVTGKNLEPQLKKELKEILHPFIIKASLQDACSAAVSLANMGELSQDVAAPMLSLLHKLAQNPEEMCPQEGSVQSTIFLQSNIFSKNSKSFPFMLLEALTLFKGDENILNHLNSIVYECIGVGANGDEFNRIKEFNEQKGPRFYNLMLENFVNNCLLCIGKINPPGKENETINFWAEQGNAVAQQVLESINCGENFVPLNDYIDDSVNIFAKLLNYCVSDPKRGLKEFERMKENNMENGPLFKLAKALVDINDSLLISNYDQEEKNQLLSNEKIQRLELVVLEIKANEDSTNIFFKFLAIKECKVTNDRINAVIDTLEHHKPGRVQELLGKMNKYKYDIMCADISFDEKYNFMLDLCESDPDAILEILEYMAKDLRNMAPYMRLVRAVAYGNKGVMQIIRRSQLTDEQLDNMSTWKGREFREKLKITDEQLDYLETGLGEIRELDAEVNFRNKLGEFINATIDVMEITLERCRPGRVQQILGKTKLKNFGYDRIKVMPSGLLSNQPIEMTSQNIRFVDIYFNFRSIAKSALVVNSGIDDKGRRYIWLWLLGKTFDEMKPDENFGDVRVGTSPFYDVELYDDGTIIVDSEQKPEVIKKPTSSQSEERENKKRENELVKYNGTSMIKRDADVLSEIETLLNEPIPVVSKIKYRSFGFVVHENCVIQLALSEKGLTSLPDIIGNLTSLTYLSLWINKLTYLPDTIGNLTLLKTLYLGFNQLTSLPDTIKNLTSLKKLWLYNNGLTTYPDNIKKWLKSLKKNGCKVHKH